VTWPLLAFLTFVGLLCLFIGWFMDMGQRAVDRHSAERMEIEELRAAMKRRPP
jgi:hypothetical protein